MDHGKRIEKSNRDGVEACWSSASHCVHVRMGFGYKSVAIATTWRHRWMSGSTGDLRCMKQDCPSVFNLNAREPTELLERPKLQVEHHISIAAPPERIYGIYKDVSNWHTWDPDTKSATLDGPFVVGAKGKLVPTMGNAVPMLLTSVLRNRSFTVESRIPLFQIVFEHELYPSDATTEVVHRITFSGALSFVLGRMLAKRANVGLPATLTNLKRMAEKCAAK